MALRIGKKKDEPAAAPNDDWSDAALLGQQDAPSPVVAPTTTSEPADEFVTDNFAPAPAKKAMSPALLAGGLVLLLTALGVGAYFAFFNTPPEDEAPPALPPRTARRPAAPTAVTPAPKTTRLRVPVKPGAGTAAKKVLPGRAGIVSPGLKVPAIRPKTGKVPAVVPRRNMPTPVPLMPDGMAAQSGKGSSPGATVQIVRPVAALTPALMTQLKALWNQGAAAKRERNYDGARRAWQRMLQLRPGHPGVQEAIDKLPR